MTAGLDGDAATAMACDAAMAPFVTGEVNPAALEDLVRLCVDLDRLRRHPGATPAPAPAALALAAPAAAALAVPAAAALAAARTRLARTPRGPGRPSSARSSAEPQIF